MRIRTSDQNRRRGTAVVEFAVVVALLSLLLRGMWEVGRLIELQNILTNAAREGARLASSGAYSEQQVEDAVRDYILRYGLDTTGVTYDVTNLTQTGNDDPQTANQLDHFQIVVTMPFDESRRWALAARVLNKDQIVAHADWYSMRDLPVTIDQEPPE
jgi:Flp pilus assembly protein TadG